MKIVVNGAYGAFALSEVAVVWLRGRGHELSLRNEIGTDDVACFDVPLPRDHPDLVECVEVLGDRANTRLGRLKIVEIPDDIDWVICSADGWEWVAERHRRWIETGEVDPHEPFTVPRR